MAEIVPEDALLHHLAGVHDTMFRIVPRLQGDEPLLRRQKSPAAGLRERQLGAHLVEAFLGLQAHPAVAVLPQPLLPAREELVQAYFAVLQCAKNAV